MRLVPRIIFSYEGNPNRLKGNNNLYRDVDHAKDK